MLLELRDLARKLLSNLLPVVSNACWVFAKETERLLRRQAGTTARRGKQEAGNVRWSLITWHAWIDRHGFGGI